MIQPRIPMEQYPGLAYDGTMTFSGILQTYFSHKDVTGKNTGISRRWNDNTAAQYLRDYTNRVLPTINHLYGSQKPMHEYQEEDFEAILAVLEQQYHYVERTMMHYRHLLWCAYNMGVIMEQYPDNIFWDEPQDTDDPDENERQRANALTRLRKSFSIHEEIRFLQWYCSLDPSTVPGEALGLVLMFFLGLRDNEACGACFENVQLMARYPDTALFVMVNTTGVGTNRLKAAGKSWNAPRNLVLYKPVYDFIQARKAWIQSQLDAGLLSLPEGIDSVELLPIVCKGSNVTRRASTDDLSRFGSALFQRMGISKSELAELHRILLSEEYRTQVLEEKRPTPYLLRRNTATRMYHLGFDWSTIQFWIAHKIDDPSVLRNFFADEDTLYRLGTQYLSHPSFELLSHMLAEADTSPEHPTEDHHHLVWDSAETAHIEVKANEPNTPLCVNIRSTQPFSLTLTVKESAATTGSTISILHPLRDAYWRIYRSIAK